MNVLEWVTKLSAAAAAVGLIVSVLFEIGYFSVIGFSFLPILGPLDYLRNAVLWVPVGGALLLFWAMTIFFIEYVAAFPDSQTRRYKRQNRKPVSTNPRVLLLPFGFVVFLALLPLVMSSGSAISVAPISFGICWAVFVLYVVIKKRRPFIKLFGRRYVGAGVYALVSAPTIIGSIVTIGAIYADFDLLKSKNAYAITTIIDKKLDTANGILLRSFDKGILVRTVENNAVFFLKWDSVVSLKTLRFPQLTPRYCLWLKLMCEPGPEAP